MREGGQGLTWVVVVTGYGGGEVALCGCRGWWWCWSG